MGMSDTVLYGHLYNEIKLEGDVALLGFPNNNHFRGTCYDLQLGNWEINSDWNLGKKYDTIVCLRTAYFSKDPEDFIKRCYDHLNEGGKIYVDWGLGDHWRYKDYKVGWRKDGEQEQAYEEGNYLWSTVWSDMFLKNHQCQLFQRSIERYGYYDIKEAVSKEVPKVLDYKFIERYFYTNHKMLTLWHLENPQLYVLISGVKK